MVQQQQQQQAGATHAERLASTALEPMLLCELYFCSKSFALGKRMPTLKRIYCPRCLYLSQMPNS